MRRSIVAGVVALAVAVPALPADAQASGSTNQETSLELTAKGGWRGSAAVDRLDDGGALDVARGIGWTEAQLTSRLRTDPSLVLTDSGDVVAVDRFSGLRAETASEAASTPDVAKSAVLPPGVDVFALHSKPGAEKVLYLDVNGHLLQGTLWNRRYGRSVIQVPGLDYDNVPSTFNDSERAAIAAMWIQVADDYAPFPIDVTTENPGLERIRRTSFSDRYYGARHVVGNFGIEGGASGVCFLGSFGVSVDTPCLGSAFSFFGAISGRGLGKVASHELGHSLGLSHDGTPGQEYSDGQGDWSPIMGNGLRGINQWSNGEYVNANNHEDDYAVMAQRGLPVQADEAGGSPPEAAVLPILSGFVDTKGMITTRADRDVWSFVTNGGISLTIAPTTLREPTPFYDPSLDTPQFPMWPYEEPNLNIAARLLRPDGSEVAASDPPGMAPATFALSVPPGQYFLEIDGVGEGNPAVDGYSDYGSVGEYAISGTIAAPAVVTPVAAISGSPLSGFGPLAVQFSSAGSGAPDGTPVTFRWDFGDGTPSTNAPNPAHLYPTAGNYVAKVWVITPGGVAAVAAVAVNVALRVEQPPNAAASARVREAFAPFVVRFSSAGSFDPEGKRITYRWNFGDGKGSRSRNPSHRYSRPGQYVATLTVTDDKGLSSTAQVQVTAYRKVVVRSVQLRRVGPLSVQVKVTLRDGAGKPVAGAAVTGRLGGVGAGDLTAVTNRSGVATFAVTAAQRGTLRFSTIAVAPAGGLERWNGKNRAGSRRL
jgi:PKD repeat protein